MIRDAEIIRIEIRAVIQNDPEKLHHYSVLTFNTTKNVLYTMNAELV